MIAKLMELTNTLFRYRGTAVAGGPEWDEAIRLLLLMLAPAAPHISEELWSRRLAAAGQPWTLDPRRGVARGRCRPPSSSRPARSRSRSTASCATRSIVAGRRHDRRHRGGRPGPRPDQGDPRRPDAGPDRRRRRRQARQPRRPVTESEDALAFDRHLDATAPAVADIARALRLTVLDGFPDADRDVRPGDGLLAIGTRPVDARLLLRDHPAQGAREPAARRRRRPAEPGRPDRGHRQAGPPRQGPLGRGRAGAPGSGPSIGAQVAHRPADAVRTRIAALVASSDSPGRSARRASCSRSGSAARGAATWRGATAPWWAYLFLMLLAVAMLALAARRDHRSAATAAPAGAGGRGPRLAGRARHHRHRGDRTGAFAWRGVAAGRARRRSTRPPSSPSR